MIKHEACGGDSPALQRMEKETLPRTENVFGQPLGTYVKVPEPAADIPRSWGHPSCVEMKTRPHAHTGRKLPVVWVVFCFVVYSLRSAHKYMKSPHSISLLVKRVCECNEQAKATTKPSQLKIANLQDLRAPQHNVLQLGATN